MHIALPAYHYQIPCFVILSSFSPLDVKLAFPIHRSVPGLQFLTSHLCVPHTEKWRDYLNYQGLFEESPFPWALPFSLQSFLNWKSKSPSIQYLEITTAQLGSTSFFHRHWHCMYHISQHSAVYIYTHLQAKAVYQFTQKRAIQKHAPPCPQTSLAHLHLLPLVPSTLARHWYLGIAVDIILLSG